MRYQELLTKSRAHLRQFPIKDEVAISPFIFTNGAKWMLDRMNELDGGSRVFDDTIPYEKYGYFKYGICFLAFLLSGFMLFKNAFYLLPLAVLVFYFLEVHFLFLFPLLIDKVEFPLLKSIQMTHKMGVIQAIITVIPIGFFMLLGLFNWRDPLRNWYLGCLSILIWYVYERN